MTFRRALDVVYGVGALGSLCLGYWWLTLLFAGVGLVVHFQPENPRDPNMHQRYRIHRILQVRQRDQRVRDAQRQILLDQETKRDLRATVRILVVLVVTVLVGVTVLTLMEESPSSRDIHQGE